MSEKLNYIYYCMCVCVLCLYVCYNYIAQKNVFFKLKQKCSAKHDT